MRIRFYCFLVAVSLSTSLVVGQPVEVPSPNSRIAATLSLVEGVPHWQVVALGQPLLEPGKLGLHFADGNLGPLHTLAVTTRSIDETIETTWGKFSQYANRCNELTWTLRETTATARTLQIILRAYDDGIAVRYRLPEHSGWDSTIRLADDLTEYCFSEDATGWCYAGEHDPIGPQPLSRFHQSEKIAARLPLVVQFPSGLHAAVMEAAIEHIAPMDLVALEGRDSSFRTHFAASTLASGGVTSWRTLLVGKSAGDLLTSPLLECLNPACAIEDTDWIQPGLAMWDWRAWGATTDDGFTYGLDMPSWRRFVDFAATHGIGYLVLDAGWYGLEFEATSDPRTSRPYLLVQPDPKSPRLVPQDPPANWQDPTDIPELIRYARDKEVGIILYFNDIARVNFPFDETLALYQKWGAAGIKYGFMKGNGQKKVLDTRMIVKKCAEHQLLCDFHDDPIPPSGDQRTYPNYVTREFCHSQSDALRSFSPSDFCEQVFVNMLAGPLDMCNGLYTLENPARDRPKVFMNVDSTVVAETARVMIVFSGLSILPDCPEAYEAKADLFEFLGKLPMTWQETRILHGKIGHFITTARRSGSEWFIASATNEQSRSLPIKLDFLEPNQTYTATLYEDAPDADYLHNREAYRIRRIEVKQGDKIDATMAPGGGHCVWIRRTQ
ncbi:glycoside hydrolase family 97 protein [Novipirellula artificiosorum]|nr:glycoside hydrolase family 97 protein [Novipirellula artificiosorum]